MLVGVRRTEQGLDVDLTGEWRALQLTQIDAELAAVDLSNAHRVSIGTESLSALDLSGVICFTACTFSRLRYLPFENDERTFLCWSNTLSIAMREKRASR